jgi:hypothetical protein
MRLGTSARIWPRSKYKVNCGSTSLFPVNSSENAVRLSDQPFSGKVMLREFQFEVPTDPDQEQ